MFENNYRFILLFVGFLSTATVSCNNRNRGVWQVPDITKDTLLNAETNIKDVTTMILKINGHTDDTIRVHSIAIPGGDIKKELKVDWYNPKITVKVEAYRAKKGNIEIQYYVPSSY